MTCLLTVGLRFWIVLVFNRFSCPFWLGLRVDVCFGFGF